MACRIVEIRGMGGRTDIGWNARLVDADNIVSPPLDQVVRHRCADDAAEPDNHDFRLLGKLCHFMRSWLFYYKTIVVGWSRHLPLYDIFAAPDDRALERFGSLALFHARRMRFSLQSSAALQGEVAELIPKSFLWP